MNKKILTLVAILFLSVSGSLAQITFYTNEDSYTDEVAQLLIEYTGKLAEPLINYTSIYVAQVTDGQDFTGFIVVTPTVNPIEPLIRLVERNGAIAVILAQDSILHPGRSLLETDGSRAKDISIPAFEIGSTIVSELPSIYTSENTQILVSIEPTGNYWLVLNDAHIDIAFSIVIGGGAGCCIGLAIWKLILFARARGRCANGIPQTCLTLHLVANIIRFLYVVVDPLGIRHYWTYYVDNIMFTLPYPLIIVASLLMSLYWFETMTSASLAIYPGLKKMRIPFIAFSIALGALEITCGILRSSGVTGASITFYVTAIVYCVAIASMSIFYMIVSIMLLKRMKASQVANNKRAKNLRIVTWLIIGSVIGFWVCIVSIIIFLFPEVAGSVPGWLAVNFMGMMSFIAVSTCQILVFNPKSAKTNSSSGPRNKHSGDSTVVNRTSRAMTAV